MDDAAPGIRQLDMESLKALAHPLRVQIVDMLSTYGSFTASGLAERLGESSGATSYHLRQLEKHGFVREVPGKGTARERWWERVPGAISLNGSDLDDSPASRAASKTVAREWERSRSAALVQFHERGSDELPPPWSDSGVLTTINMRLTPEQLADLIGRWEEFIDPFVTRYRGQNPPGSRPVQLHFNAFPLVDGDETPDERVER